MNNNPPTQVQKLPLQFESIESARARFRDSVSEVYEIHAEPIDYAKAPGFQRRHVFDTDINGVQSRLIVSHDRMKGVEFIHFSISADPARFPLPASFGVLAQHAYRVLSDISGARFPGHQFTTAICPQALHIFIPWTDFVAARIRGAAGSN